MGQLLMFFFMYGSGGIILSLILYRFIDMFIDWLVKIIEEIAC